MLEHGAMGTDHRLNAGDPVNGPETKKKGANVGRAAN